MLMLGTENGQLYGYVWDGTEMNVEKHIKFNENDAFDSVIQGIMLGDDQRDGRIDVWVASGGQTRMFSGWVMVESLTIEGPVSQGPIDMILHTIDAPAWDEIGIEDGILTSYTVNTSHSAVVATPVNQPALILQDSTGYWIPIYWSQIIALVASTILMIALTIRPEWYVVNTTGILTGAGVITIIGVSFVPTLIVIFMVVAAVYDYYAVYKSKHMLDLADTMISLKLPILLVAPQDKQYSFLDEGEDTMSRVENDVAPSANKKERSKKSDDGIPMAPPPSPRPKKSGGDALFMGLGDVIFPGMLVISALTFLPSGSTFMGLDEPMFVAIGTLIGGLIGYFVLMGYVAMGRPQAGLPLLNGGSILGYLITGLLAIGTGALSFGITIF
jgi:presenilin-like A22 family membrane protease